MARRQPWRMLDQLARCGSSNNEVNPTTVTGLAGRSRSLLRGLRCTILANRPGFARTSTLNSASGGPGGEPWSASEVLAETSHR